MFLSLPELQKERGFPHPSRKKKLLKLKRESTHSIFVYTVILKMNAQEIKEVFDEA